MLDHAQPTRLDRHASSIQAAGPGWVDADIAICLVHAEDVDATIEVGIARDRVEPLYRWDTRPSRRR